MKAQAMPSHIEPMLALPSTMPTALKDYAFEYKWDGIRAIFYWDGRDVRIESRNMLDVTHRWPELRELGSALGSTAAILDGEIVALDPKGRISFDLLKKRMHLASKPTARMMRDIPIAYMIFDVLYLDDRVLMSLAYSDRRNILERLKLGSDTWQVPKSIKGNGEALFEAALVNGLEGVMAKKHDSQYVPGKRSRAWLKIKGVNRQELVIGGWIPEKGLIARGVGALLVGYYDQHGRLIFAGKVGTGFSDADRMQLKRRFDDITRDQTPFSSVVRNPDAIFVDPVTVAEIEFREWTPEGSLRHPSFKGLREDKNPREVTKETIPHSSEAE